MTQEQYIYRITLNELVVAVFNKKQYALDFIDYQKTISSNEFELEQVKLSDYLLQPRDF